MKTLTTLLKNQTEDSYKWIDKIKNEFPEEKWFTIPDSIDTNFAWQIGHLTLSLYYYNIVLLSGPNPEISNQINLKKYSEYFSNGNKKHEIMNVFEISELKSNWDFLKNKTLNFISNLEDVNLNEEIFQLPKQHPFVKTKENSISWNIKHTMWHCGQISTLIRIVHQPFDPTK